MSKIHHPSHKIVTPHFRPLFVANCSIREVDSYNRSKRYSRHTLSQLWV